jgi:predicted DNA-binding transcriptional regulator AlpA
VVRRIRLWGAWEIQQALGVGRTRTYEIIARPGFPTPADDTMRGGAVWYQDEIEAWIAQHRRRPEPIAEPTEGEPDAG